MKLTIKTLAKSTFTVEIEPEKTVKELKEKIEKEQGKDYPPAAQKLIYSGKILADENKLSEYEFDEKKFVVLMITRPPPPPKPAPAPAPVTESKAKPATDEKPKPAPTSTATVSSAPSGGTTSTSTTTSASQQTPVTAPSTAELAARLHALNDASAALGVGEPQVAARLASLMSQPHFRQIQDLIQQSPHLLSSTIESLAASDPEMYSFMSDNPDLFVNALNHPPMAGSRRTNTSQSSMPSAMAAAAAAAAASQAPPGSRVGSQQAVGGPGGRQQPVVDSILHNVSQQDKEAIERLKELGFSEYLAFQAYMACDKDEQLAANLLFQMDQ